MIPRRLLVIDLETTGIEPSTDSIVQIGSCLLSQEDLSEERFFCTYVKPTSPMSSEARAVHGIDEAMLRNAPDLREAIYAFAEYAPPDAIVCGHNVAFDVAFLKKGYSAVGVPYPFDYHTLDVWSVAFFMLAASCVRLPSYNLTALSDFGGYRRKEQHDALEDARATAAVLRRFFALARGLDLSVLGGA